MALRVGTAYVDVVPKVSGNFGSDVDKAISPGADAAGKKAGGLLGGSMGKAALAVGGGALAAKATQFLSGAVDAARESAKVVAQTEAVVKSTGAAANVSVGHVGKLAGSLSNMTGIDDEAIASGENLLLTFTNVKNVAGEGNDVFDQATKTLVDMGAALGTDTAGSAIQLGKALNDPIKGIAALSRVGVTFTDDQKKMIEGMVKAGDTAGAQKVILGELNKEFGGSAAAQATNADRMKVAWGNLQEEVGNKLVPVLDKVSGFLVEHSNLIGPLAAVIGGVLVLAFTAWAISAASAAVATIAAAAPVLAVIAVIGLLVAAIFFLVTHWSEIWEQIKAIAGAAWEWIKGVFSAAWAWVQGAWDAGLNAIKDAWNTVWGGVKDVLRTTWDAIKSAFRAGLDFVTGVWSAAWNGVKSAFTTAWDAVTGAVRTGVETVKNIIQGLRDGISRILGGVAEVIKAPFVAVFRGIATVWNSTVGKLRFRVPSWVPGIGGKGFDVPTIPLPSFHTGGLVPGRPGSEMLAVLQAGEYVVPRSDVGNLGAIAGGSGGGFTIERLDVHESADPDRTWRTANRELRAAAFLAGWES